MATGSARIYQISALFGLFLSPLLISSASAQDDLSVIHYIPDFVSFDYGLDNDHGRSTFIFANLGITNEDRLLLGIGDQLETVSGSEEDLDNETYLLGYSYLPSYEKQFSVEYEHWGDSAKVTVNTLRAVLGFNAGFFAITVTPEYRQINVKNDSQCDDQIDSGSARIALSVDLNPEYTFNVSYVSYDYSNNLTALGDCVSNAETLEVQSRIDSVSDDNQLSLGLDYYQDSESYGGSLLRSKTALSGLRSSVLSVYASTDRYDDWSLTVTTGIIENTDDSTTLFLNGGATYYW